MVRIAAALLIAFAWAWGAPSPLPYAALAEPIERDFSLIRMLSRVQAMEPHRQMLEAVVRDSEALLTQGRGIAAAEKADPVVSEEYLRRLREMAKQTEAIEILYRRALHQAMARSDLRGFEELVSIPFDTLHHPRTRSAVIAFYREHYPPRSIKAIETLAETQALEDRSLQIAMEQEQAYEEHLRILKRSEASAARKTARIGSRTSVLLSGEKNARGGIDFEAENLNPYTVTLSMDFESMSNLASPVKLPLLVEIPGKSRKKVLELTPLSPGRGVAYRSTYGWVRGSAFAVHDDGYLYALPFAKGTGVQVSQGYHGGKTHKGLSAYAVDFPVPTGTPIYAAREGVVVGAEGGYNRGGLSPEYRQYANYVIIEHADGTMGNYYHLRQGGAAVRIGQKVSRGELIGYSGNTGYSSGPHLHFSVSKVDPVSMRRPMNLPVRLEAKEGIVTFPRQGERYTVR